MANPKEVRELIRLRLRSGQLPHTGKHEVFGRKGDGLPCACCDQLITPQQIEHDVEFASDLGTLSTMPMHAYCYHAWQEVSGSIQSGEQVAS